MPLDDETIALARDRVEEDVARCFGEALTPVEGFRIDLQGLSDAESVTTSELLVAVPWAYSCVHTGDFLDVQPTFAQLELRGMTVVEVDGKPNRWKYHRFVDFLGALHQMGVTTTTRPMLDTDKYEAWNEARS